MLVWIRILAGLWLWGRVLLSRQITACTQSCLFCSSPDAHVHVQQEFRLDPSSKTASSFPFCWELPFLDDSRQKYLQKPALCQLPGQSTGISEAPGQVLSLRLSLADSAVSLECGDRASFQCCWSICSTSLLPNKGSLVPRSPPP